MKKFNYFHNGIAITKAHFEMNVPKDWESKVDELGHYSFGYYTAEEIN